MGVFVDGKTYQTMDEITDTVILIRLKSLNYNRSRTAKSLGRGYDWVATAIKRLKRQGHKIPDNPIEKYKFGAFTSQSVH